MPVVVDVVAKLRNRNPIWLPSHTEFTSGLERRHTLTSCSPSTYSCQLSCKSVDT